MHYKIIKTGRISIDYQDQHTTGSAEVLRSSRAQETTKASNHTVMELLLYLASNKDLTITNWRLFLKLNMKPHKILGGHSKQIEKF